jgi:hypothetical protein
MPEPAQPTEPGTTAADTPTEPTEPTSAEAAGTDDIPESEVEEDPAAGGEEPGAADEPATPPAEKLAAGCYSVVVAFESSRQPGGKYSPWKPQSVDSRKPIKCSAVPNRGTINNAQGLYDYWPNAPEEILSGSPMSFQPKKQGEPDTRRMVVKAYTQVSQGSR